MSYEIRTRMDRRLIQILVIICCVVAAVTVSYGIMNPPEPVQKPFFTSSETADIFVDYDGYTVSFSVPVNLTPQAVSGLGKTTTFLTSGSETESQISGYYRRMVGDPDQTRMLHLLYLGFSMAKERLKLSDDEFVDLVVRYVQSLEYVTVHSMVKYPVETVLDQAGDCDDRALLLTGILSEAGYDVCLFSFDAEAHAAAGIRVAPGYDFQNTGYAYIETTGPAYIGDVPLLEGNISVRESTPEVVAIGNGTRWYGAIRETQAILDMRTDAKSELSRLAELIRVQTGRVDMLKARLPYYQGMNKIDYEMKHDEYVHAVGLLNKYVSQYNRNADISNYIAEHAGDRKTVYRVLFPDSA